MVSTAEKNLPLWGRWRGEAVTKEDAAPGRNFQIISGEYAHAKYLPWGYARRRVSEANRS
jgi:hypothetical protein